jgi:hypothetical protein
VAQNGFPQARRPYGEERGLVRKWLLAIFNRLPLGHVEFGCKFEVDRAQEGAMPDLPTNFILYFVAEAA